MQLKNVQMSWISEHNVRHFVESRDRIFRYVEDVDIIRERAQIVKDEISTILSDKLNKNMYVLSVIASHQIDSGDASQNSVISIVSNDITITTGVADQDSFTLAVQTFNTESLNEAGVTTDLTVFAADHFNNFVPDNTAIYIASEGGAVGTIDAILV